tara:strand:+ start:372 stop:596 length:225 start_codon:yes stop_codon:yes gene_type:complete
MLEAAARRPRDRNEIAERLRDGRFLVWQARGVPALEFQARATEELGIHPDGSAIAETLTDYAVMRDQARVCSRH